MDEQPGPSTNSLGRLLTGLVDRVETLTTAVTERPASAPTDPNELAGAIKSVLDGHARALNPSAPDYHGVSEFAPQGANAKAACRLKRKFYVNGAPAFEEELTPGEIAMYNALSDSLPRAGDKRMTRGGRYVAEVNQANDTVFVTFPCKNVDDLMNVPVSASLLMRELTAGEAVVTVDAIWQRVAQLEAENAALKAAAAVPVD